MWDGVPRRMSTRLSVSGFGISRVGVEWYGMDWVPYPERGGLECVTGFDFCLGAWALIHTESACCVMRTICSCGKP